MSSPVRLSDSSSHSGLRRTRRWILGLLGTLSLLTLTASPGALLAAAAGSTTRASFCSRLGHGIQASSGAQMFCRGPQPSGPATRQQRASPAGGRPINVDAATPSEDQNPAGVQAYGQSEVSVAGTGPYVVEAWNDATGFFTPCNPSPPMYKEELTGYGFSRNGGASFVDMGGLPNLCDNGYKFFGDASVETWTAGGATYFYISSLYLNSSTGRSAIALDACKVTTTLVCPNIPTIVASGAGSGSSAEFLDKDFLTIDPVRGRLYATYTRFGPTASPTANGQVELAVCDIGTHSGGPGPSGGTASSPRCFPGGSVTPYFVVAPGDRSCENEGAYPAVDLRSGDTYVAWEFNWATNFSTPACQVVPTTNKVAYVPLSCLTLTPASPCTGPKKVNAVKVVSMDAAFIPGYNRFPMNDFPRIAVSEPFGTVSFVWNDARVHPWGDILLQSFNLVTLAPASPMVILNTTTGGWHMLPALRNVGPDGTLNVSFYARSSPNTALTDVWKATRVNPRTGASTAQILVTNTPTDWNAVSSDIVPNFGDYTDNYVIATSQGPTFTGIQLYNAWSDGRLGLPQPFEENQPT